MKRTTIKKFAHINTRLIQLPCLKAYITLWLLKSLFLYHGTLMDHNYSYQTPLTYFIKVLTMKEITKKVQIKRSWSTLILYFILIMFPHYCCLGLAVNAFGQSVETTTVHRDSTTSSKI